MPFDPLTAGTGRGQEFSIAWGSKGAPSRAHDVNPKTVSSNRDGAGEWSWRSKAVVVVLIGGLVLAMSRHADVRRDTYNSMEACQRDWASTGAAGQCRQGSGPHGMTIYHGPSYEEGARPTTASPASKIGSEHVARGGFGRSGAHFSAAG